MMKDTPKCTQNCFIIFTRESGAYQRCAPVITSETALTLTGSYNDGVVNIEVIGGGFGCHVLAPKQSSYGTFTVTATTAGDTERGFAGDSQTFTFVVEALGNDRPFFSNHHLRYKYEEVVDESFTPVFVCDDLDAYDCVSGSGPLTDEKGHESGLTIGATYDAFGYQTAVTLTGKATRPGVYCLNITGTSRYLTPGLKNFVNGANTESLIIEIMTPDYCAGDLVVVVETPIAQTTGHLEIFASKLTDYISEHLIGTFFGLYRSFNINHVDYDDRSEYLFELNGETNIWSLKGRRYLTDEPTPDYSILATAPGVMLGANQAVLPPKCGWTGGICLTGDIRYFVLGYGFFSIIGTHSVYGEVYQQETRYNAQWEGWSRPAEYVHTDGKILYQLDGIWYIDAIAVTPSNSKAVAIPYAPARLHDLVAVIGNVALNANINAGLRAVVNDVAFGIWPHYVYRRQIALPDGHDAMPSLPDAPESLGAITIPEGTQALTLHGFSETTYSDHAKFASSKQASGPWNDPFERMDGSSMSSDVYHAKSESTVCITPSHSINVGDCLDVLFGDGGYGDITYEYVRDTEAIDGNPYMHNITDPFYPTLYPHVTTHEEQGRGDNTSYPCRFTMAVGSGKNYETGGSEIFTATYPHATITGDTVGTKTTTTDLGSGQVYESTTAVSGGTTHEINVQSEFGYFSGPNASLLTAMPCRKEKVVANCILFKKTVDFEYTETAINETVSDYMNITASHERTTTIINQTQTVIGTTTVINDGVTTVYDDPTGSEYAAVLGLADSIADFSSINLNQERQYHIRIVETTTKSFTP